MNDALQIAATGLHAQQLNVDTIANNLANVNTAGFKAARVSFQDMMYHAAERPAPAGSPVQDPTRLGSGVSVGSTTRVFDAGELNETDQPLDVAIRGDGFIEVVMPDGSVGYTRGGTLQVNRDGLLATAANGLVLKASVHVPSDTTQLAIATDGRVLAMGTQTTTANEIGRIDLARFTNPGALNPLGDNVFQPTDASGDARIGKPGEDGAGTLAQGFLESSNVQLVSEMVELMIAQRAYEVSTKVVQASDEMMSMANNLRK
jgi:flagellar basal-body rod protein FlgG